MQCLHHALQSQFSIIHVFPSSGTYFSSDRPVSAISSKSDSGLGSMINGIALLIPHRRVCSCVSGNLPESRVTCVD